MTATPTLDKYPAALQALEDVYAIFNRHTASGRETPGASYLANLERRSAILDACVDGDQQARQDAVIVNILLEAAAHYYTPADLSHIAATYGPAVGDVIAFFARHDSAATVRRFPAAEYAERAAEIVYLDAGNPAWNNAAVHLRADLEDKDPTRRALAARALKALHDAAAHPAPRKPASPKGPGA
jgi:hypothetical protein